MKLSTYVIPRDYGFAPNPYFGYCTLANCKPVIRKSANIGDWIAATGSAGTSIKQKLVMLMKVGEILSFDEYWKDERFACKRPVYSKSIKYAYGDNIYHHLEDGSWMQEPSHHSNIDNSINMYNLERDTGVDRVLISTEFFYFGNNALQIPEQFSEIIKKGPNHKNCTDEGLINNFVNYVRTNCEYGVHGIPFNRVGGKFAHYNGKK